MTNISECLLSNIYPGNAATVKDGVIQRLSPTAIDEFDRTTPFGCETKWYFNRVLKMKAPETDAMKWGTDMHARIERYLRHGTDVLGPVERHGKAYIDAVKPFIVALESPVLVFIDGTQVDGKRDALVKWPTGKLEVVDWKSTSDIRKYAKDVNDMKKDTQVSVYAMDAIKDDFANFTSISVGNVYFQKGSRRASEKVTAEMGAGDLNRNYARIAEIITRMKVVAAAKDAKGLPADESKCNITREGCPYFKECPNRTHKVITLNMSFADRLKKTAPAAAVVEAIATTEPVKARRITITDVTSEVEAEARAAANDAAVAADKAAFAAAQAKKTQTVEEREAAEYEAWKKQKLNGEPADKPMSIQPPDAPKWAPPAAKAAPVVPPKVAVAAAMAATEPLPAKQLTVEYDEEVVKDAVAAVTPKRGKGRPTKAEEKAELLAELQASGVAPATQGVRFKEIRITTGFNQSIKDGAGKTTYCTVHSEVALVADFGGDVDVAHAAVSAKVKELLAKDFETYAEEHNRPEQLKGG